MSCEPQLTKRLGVHQRVTYYLGKLLMKTFTAKPETVKRDWYVVDATGKTLGRLASELALRLRGKHKAEYTPHVDTGDYIIVLNADKVAVTGNKRTDKMYYHHTGHIGRAMYRKLKVYAGNEHNHAAQQPQVLDI